MRLARLAGIEVDARLRDCHAALDPAAPDDYRELAALLACDWADRRATRVGLSGGQGAGKSTLSRLVEAAGARVGSRICVLSLDDFYLGREERLERAAREHPLFETRGVPGTHDMELLEQSMASLFESRETRLPVFDKGRDDRAGARSVVGPFDCVVLEGWCVGARGVDPSRLVEPRNALESERDPTGHWRRRVNQMLIEAYEPVWDRLDTLIHLQVPSLGAVRHWRLQQETERPADQRMTSDAVDRFIQHYERITLQMLDAMPALADWLVRLDEAHRVSGITIRKSPHGEGRASKTPDRR